MQECLFLAILLVGERQREIKVRIARECPTRYALVFWYVSECSSSRAWDHFRIPRLPLKALIRCSSLLDSSSCHCIQRLKYFNVIRKYAPTLRKCESASYKKKKERKKVRVIFSFRLVQGLFFADSIFQAWNTLVVLFHWYTFWRRTFHHRINCRFYILFQTKKGERKKIAFCILWVMCFCTVPFEQA